MSFILDPTDPSNLFIDMTRKRLWNLDLFFCLVRINEPEFYFQEHFEISDLKLFLRKS
jgi:hypothetical protein